MALLVTYLISSSANTVVGFTVVFISLSSHPTAEDLYIVNRAVWSAGIQSSVDVLYTCAILCGPNFIH